MEGEARFRGLWQAALCGWCALVLATVIGCRPAEIRPSGDAAGAKQLLTRVLDTWKSGQPPDALMAEKPAVRVADEDWRANRQLTAYELLDEPLLNGSHWRVFAKLTLSQNGKPSPPQKVCYAVTLDKVSSVLRADYLD